MKLVKLVIGLFTFTSMGLAAFSAGGGYYEDFESVVVPQPVDSTSGVIVNGITYRSFEGTGNSHTDLADFTGEINKTSGYTSQSFETKVTNNYNNGQGTAPVTWNATTKLPEVDLAYLELEFSASEDISSLSYQIDQSGTSWYWTRVLALVDGDQNWTNYYVPTAEIQSSGPLVAGGQTLLENIKKLRIYVWANGDSNPGVVSIDNISIQGTGLSYHWTFDDALTEQSGEADFSVTAGAVSYTDNTTVDPSSRAVVLDASTYVTATGVAFGSTKYSVSCWFRLNALPAATSRLFDWGGNKCSLMIEPEGGRADSDPNTNLVMRTYVRDTWDRNSYANVTLATGDWYHFVLVRDGATMQYYLNGEAVAMAGGSYNSYSINFSGQTADLILANSNNAAQPLDCAISEFKIFQMALSPDTIANEYNEDVLTPVVGMEVSHEEGVLSWSVENEIDVKTYQVVDAATGKVLETVTADGSALYSVPVTVQEVKVVVVDKSGYSQSFIPSSDTVATVYSLQEGWNLIALTGDDADLSALKAVTSGRFWGWNGESYEVIETPVAGQGFWFFAAEDSEVVVSAVKSDVSMELEQGWNLIGSVKNSEVPTDAKVVYTWSDQYEQILEDGILIQGVGYWIFK